MITCDGCGKDINTLKEAWHGIPEGNDITFICDDCYRKFKIQMEADAVKGGYYGED